jgi:thiosulfate/3-mercaptopyruvate sulfurtransferase
VERPLIKYGVQVCTTLALTIMVWGALSLAAQTPGGAGPVRPGGSREKPPELSPGSASLISPEDLARTLQTAAATKPLILSVGPRLLYVQAHIAGAEFMGPSSDAAALQVLRDRVKNLPRNSTIVIYCGCCPWNHCPNVEPAYLELKKLGFTKAKVLYLASNLGTDWVYKGYPTAQGQ